MRPTDQLYALYQQELAHIPGEEELAAYLRAHSGTASAMGRQVRSVERYLPYVRGRVLDWGCMHAPDAAILRLLGKNDVELHGCDIFPENSFPVFHGFSGLQYKCLDHHYRLPYADETFDTVISDGVLEHVPNDLLSLQEVYRILKPNGHLIICCLPNCYSYTEFLGRCLGMPHHLRTYSLKQARGLLLHNGFLPLTSRYYQMAPSLSGAGMSLKGKLLRGVVSLLWFFNPLLERLWPLNRLSSNLYFVARKCRAISWSRHQPLAA
jgi:SAM-dependent methyltransferase